MQMIYGIFNKILYNKKNQKYDTKSDNEFQSYTKAIFMGHNFSNGKLKYLHLKAVGII